MKETLFFLSVCKSTSFFDKMQAILVKTILLACILFSNSRFGILFVIPQHSLTSYSSAKIRGATRLSGYPLSIRSSSSPTCSAPGSATCSCHPCSCSATVPSHRLRLPWPGSVPSHRLRLPWLGFVPSHRLCPP